MLETPTIITKNHLLSSANDFTPLSRTTRTSTTATNSWALSDLDTRINSDNWDRPTSISPITRKQNPAFATNMSSRQDNKHMHASSAVDPSSRWRFNNTGQLVDQETAGWDLSDEIVRLKINDGKEDGSVRTPPQSRLSSVAQLVESSPLETASSASSSPHNSERQGPSSHSRGPSIDSTASGANKLVPPPSLKIDTNGEPKGRPHSYSGTLSTADLRRLQTAGESPVVESSESPINQWTPTQFRGESNPEQLPYPSLANNLTAMQRQAAQNAAYASELRSGGRVDQASEYGNFGGSGAAQFVPGRPNMTYRPAPRGYPQQGMMSPSSLGFSGGPQAALTNNQQLYEMMLSENLPQSGNRQVPNAFRGAHQHSSSDPSVAREAAAIAALNGGLPPFAGNPAMFPPASMPGMAMYANQFYPQEAFQRGDPSQILAARLQAQYTGSQSYGMMTPPPMEPGVSGPPSSTGSSQNGPSANNRKLGLYKTELCRSWEEKGTCRYGTKCQFAHGEDELRNVSRHPKYKTEICRTFWVSGSCPYGKRCCFIHTELPVPGAPAPGGMPGNVENSPQPQQHHDGRARSMSTNSDPNEGGGTSLLARISAKRTQDSNTNSSTPVDNNSPYQLSRPPTGSLRVDTSSLDTSNNKQNKSAYPTYASNGVGVLKPASDNVTLRSPVPVTAGPDFGRQSSARHEIVGFNRGKSGTPPTHNPRHSFSGTEDINFGGSPPHPGPNSSYTLESSQPAQGHRLSGHVRSGSAGNWGGFAARNSSHLSNSAYPSSPVGGDITSPWSTTELTSVGPSRLSDKAWA